MKLFVTVLSILALSSTLYAINDNFLWLEEVEGKKALSWVEEQNKITLDTLEQDKQFNNFFNSALTISQATDRIAFGSIRGKHVYNFWTDKVNVKGLWRRTTFESYLTSKPNWEVLIDIDRLSKEQNESFVFKGSNCLKPDYKRCIISLSRGGKDATVKREFNTSTKKFVIGDTAFNLKEGKSSLTWIDKDTMLLSNAHGPDTLTTSGYPREVRLWKRGTKITNSKLVFKGKKSDMGVWNYRDRLDSNNKINFLIRAIDMMNQEYFYLDKKYDYHSIPVPKTIEFKALFKGQMIFTLEKDFNLDGKTLTKGVLYSFDWKKTISSDKLADIKVLFKPDSSSSIGSTDVTKDYFLVTTNKNVKSVLWKYTFENKTWKKEQINAPKNSKISVISTSEDSSEVFLAVQSYIIPESLMLLSGTSLTPKTLQSVKPRFDSSNLIVKQLWATSKDGTKVPYTMIAPKDYLSNDGHNKTLLYGYGGFNVSLTPSYLGSTGKIWSEKGGIHVVANIRGGGEFGPSWHQAALKKNRHKAFEDFIAIATDLIKRNITRPKYLGISGGSNGGLLVGAVMTMRPDLINAVVCSVPLLDMLRFHKLLAGPSWMGEYGNPEDPEMKDYIASYSPYHNVYPDVNYPKAFFYTSTKDDRVHPGHARKMVAKMKSQGHDVFYYENLEGGHSGGADKIQAARLKALKYVYLNKMLGN